MEKMKASKSWEESHSVAANAGSKIMMTFTRDTATGRLVKTGEIDLSEQADAAALGCGVYGIIDRIQRGSNVVDLPSPSDGQFADLSGAGEIYAADSLAATKKLQDLQKTQNETAEKVDDTNSKLEQALAEIAALKEQLKGDKQE